MSHCFDSHVSRYMQWLTDNTPRVVTFAQPPAWGPWRQLVDARILNG